ncbi:MAG: hypothetical protein DWQ36_00575 [Acidobacteria bacterium]|nr:MAG: hypothetical protein DWQ30_18735 [Acidobacteriota bacterium]REK12189.1 MAG: hypothetical protein DWQ36_00575 [Acidobacteriota bacterium]
MLPLAASCAAIVALTAALAGSPASAQVQILDPPDLEAAAFSDGEFLSLYGDRSAVGFQPGALDRAHHFLRRLEVITEAFNRWSGVAVPVVGYLVDREKWNEMQMPGLYGIPLRTSATAIVLPSRGDDETVRMWRSILGVEQLPLNPGEPLRGTSEEAASLAIVDVLAQVEAARAFALQAELVADEEWIGEVAAHLAARTLFADVEPAKLGAIDFVYDRIYERFGGERQHALAEFRADGLVGEVADAETWLWFQGAFARAARVLHEQRGRKSVKHLKKLSERGRLDGAGLRDAYPGLAAWLDSAFR